MSNYKSIRDRVPRGELLAQLAEECAELGQAALKLRRAIVGTNPTPVSREAAEAALTEEIADVLLCIDLACMDRSWPIGNIFKAMEAKEARWLSRLTEGDADPDSADKANRQPAEQEPPRM